MRGLFRDSFAHGSGRCMGIPVIIAMGSCATTLGLIVRGLFIYLDHLGDRKLTRHVFDQTGSTDGLRGYAALCRARRVPSASQDADRPEHLDAGPDGQMRGELAPSGDEEHDGERGHHLQRDRAARPRPDGGRRCCGVICAAGRAAMILAIAARLTWRRRSLRTKADGVVSSGTAGISRSRGTVPVRRGERSSGHVAPDLEFAVNIQVAPADLDVDVLVHNSGDVPSGVAPLGCASSVRPPLSHRRRGANLGCGWGANRQMAGSTGETSCSNRCRSCHTERDRPRILRRHQWR